MKYKILSVILVIFVLTLTGLYLWRHHSATYNTQPPKTTDPNVVTFLPLGDSYTIGQSVAENERWPDQLAASYKPNGKQLSIIANPSVTGYTTQDLIRTELPLVSKLRPDFVTVLIGVNDYVQGYTAQTFQKNLEYIINQLQQKMVKPQNILLITIPDYSKTPTGAQYGDPVTSTKSIEQFNQIITVVAGQAKLPVADIFSVSQQVAVNSSLIAPDGLHPSGKEYKSWVDIIQQSLITAGIPR